MTASAVSGALEARKYNMDIVGAAATAFVTAFGGGILRDLFCNQIPSVFRQNTELYATCSFIGTWVFILLIWLKMDAMFASSIGAGVVFILRLAAVKYKMTLPAP